MPISDHARAKVRERFARDQIDTVRIVREVLGDPDPVTLEIPVTAPAPVYDGPARIGRATPDATVSLGDGEVATRSVTIQVPYDVAGLRVNDQVLITACQDSEMLDTSWRVTGIDGGGSWNVLTSLSCSGWYPSNLWGPS